MLLPRVFKLFRSPTLLPPLLAVVALAHACKRDRIIIPREAAPARPATARPGAAPPHALRHQVVLGARCRLEKAKPCTYGGMLDRHYRSVLVRHEAAEGRLLLTIPEGVRFRPLCGEDSDRIWTGDPARKEPAWEVSSSGLSYVERWRAGGPGGPSLKARWRIYCASSESVGLELTVTNVGKKMAGFVEPMVCLAADKNSCSGMAALAHDRGAARLAHTAAGWWKFNDTAQLTMADNPYRDARACYHGGALADVGLVVSESKDRAWTMGLGWDRAVTLSIGSQECIHSHPSIQRLRPGQTVTRHGRAFLTRKGKAAALKRFRGTLGKKRK